MPCIYIFTSPKGKSYIGQAVDFEKRKFHHLYSVPHGSLFPIHRAIRMHGIDNFQIETINCESDELNLFERLFIGIFKGIGKVYNCTDGGEGSVGFKHSPESKEKMRVKQLKQNLSDETIQRMSESAKKRIASIETRKKMSIAGLGRKFSEEWKAKIGKANLGLKRTEETKKKLRELRKAEWVRRKSASVETQRIVAGTVHEESLLSA